MADLEAWIVPMTMGCAVLGCAGVVLWSRGHARPGSAAPRAQGNVQEMECIVCHRTLVFNPTQLERLSPAEMALVVRARPQVVGLPLAEHECPFCAAAHCFVIRPKTTEWVGANLYQPQDRTANCHECRTPLRAPSWPRGAYDDRIQDAPTVLPDYGVQCSRCLAVCCYACCEATGRRRGQEGTLVCPRCMRASIRAFYHP